jgi:hypothetical protein
MVLILCFMSTPERVAVAGIDLTTTDIRSLASQPGARFLRRIRRRVGGAIYGHFRRIVQMF